MAIRRLLPPDATAYRALMLEAYAAHPDAFTSSLDERASLPLSWGQKRLADEATAANARRSTCGTRFARFRRMDRDPQKFRCCRYD